MMHFPLISAAVASLAATGAALPTTYTAAVDELIFDASISTFQNARETTTLQCNWSSEICWWWPGKPQAYDFRPICARHDFGYRNTKAQKRFTEAMKESIDLNFLTNVYDYCAQKAANERLPSVLDIELDDVIVGQEIPGVRRWGIAVSDLVAWLGPEEE
ncbi:secretory phospholipase A2 [Akanthomyces lecanii RCEF 1005]|uniref:Secretory phospholipase A2 n=1 Tax=Akanthomyces lecanii RCEF 1005 TaxID=1081108 RepID=A0A168HKI4_CORDF|nr:secretory phospholipase A2 [Akanthomyces lecanii RCEF 1005]